MPFPDIDPVLFQIGPVAIRWYSLAYVGGLLVGWRYCLALTRYQNQGPSPTQISDFLFWATLGVIVGGRLGYVLFYMPHHFMRAPQDIFMVWQGGMSFHGGCLGVVVAAIVFARRHHIPLLPLGDLLAAAAPIGLGLGRVANFINGELFGRPTDLPWGVVFPRGGNVSRHPSQLYEAALEGVVLFVVIAVLIRRARALAQPGLITGVFFLGYGLSRFVVEFARQPDAHLGLVAGGATLGQWLSLPMIPVGLVFIYLARARHCPPP